MNQWIQNNGEEIKYQRKKIGNLNQKETLHDSNLQKFTKAELINIVNKLLSKINKLETKVDKVDEKVDDLKLKTNKQDEIVEDTRKEADTILLILEKKEIRGKKASCMGKAVICQGVISSALWNLLREK